MRTLVVLLLAVTVANAYRSYHKQQWRPRRPVCDPVKCDEFCVEVKDEKGCPTCECPKCSEPVCELPCKIIKPEDGPCPACDCPPMMDDKKIDFDKPMCSPPKCPLGCEIEKVFDGPCPGCFCKDEDEDIKDIGIEDEIDDIKEFKKIKDPIPEITKPRCLPPKCPPGCEIEKVFDGPCPGCFCKKDEVKIDKPICDPVKCLPGCSEVPAGPEGCLKCECKPICDPPKCGPDCELVEKGECPECDCKGFDIDIKIDDEELKKKCPLVEKCEEPGCVLKEDEDGCPKCVCEPICEPPKCPRRCKVKQLEGKCPECVCGFRRFRWRKN